MLNDKNWNFFSFANASDCQHKHIDVFGLCLFVCFVLFFARLFYFVNACETNRRLMLCHFGMWPSALLLTHIPIHYFHHMTMALFFFVELCLGVYVYNKINTYISLSAHCFLWQQQQQQQQLQQRRKHVESCVSECVRYRAYLHFILHLFQ